MIPCIESLFGLKNASNERRIASLLILAMATGAMMRADSFVELTGADGTALRFDSIVAAFEALDSGGTLVIAGRHVVEPDYGGGGNAPSSAPLRIQGKNDVVIRGIGGARIYGAGPGDFLSISTCTNIVLEGITFAGDRPQAGLIPNGLFSMVRLADANREVSIVRCRFIDFGNHGVSHLWGPKLSEDVLISECHFEGGGAIGVPHLNFDGAAVSGIGSNWKITANTVINCVRGFELENSGSNVVRDVLIQGNTLVDIKDLGVMLFATNHDGEKFKRIVIRDNHFSDFRHMSGSATAIRLAGGSQITVSGNQVENMGRQGISFVSADGVIQDLVIEGNTILRVGNNGVALRMASHPLQRAVIRHNHIGFCGEAGIRVMDVPDVVILNNVCFNNGLAVSAAGIEVRGEISRRPLLDGNRCYDDRADKTQSYGIHLFPGVSFSMLRDNFCLDTESTVAGILDEGSLSDCAGNKVSISLNPGSGRELTVSLLAAPPHATITVSEEGRIRIAWPAGKDDFFSVEFKQSISTPSWSLLQAGIMAVAGEASVEDTVEDFSERIYRIVRH